LPLADSKVTNVEKRKISLLVATAVGLGAIIGAGIFVLSGTAIALAGSGALLAFILVGIVALIVAYEMGELGSIIPNATGASYSYAYNALGSELGFVTGLLLYFSMATSISAVALGFGSYLSSLLGISIQTYQSMFAIVIIAVFSAINLRGLGRTTKVDATMVALKIGILIIFIAFGLLYFHLHPSTGTINLGGIAFSGITLTAIFGASVAIFFAYSGFQNIATFTNRVKGGPNNAARAILYAVLISMVVYVLVTLALLMLAPAAKYSISGDPLAFALSYADSPNWLEILVAIGAVIATASVVLVDILASSRMLYQVGVDHLLPGLVKKYDKKRDVPINGVVITGVIAILGLFIGNIYVIAAVSNFGLLFSFLMASVALIHFRREGRTGSFKTPLYPYTPVVAIIGLLIFMFGMPQIALVVGVIMIIMLLVGYYFLREYRSKKVIKVRLFK
jgi:APA family basic amino acid/polyamine antiporter